MLCLRCSRGAQAAARPLQTTAAASISAAKPTTTMSSRRTLTYLAPLRPALSSLRSSSPLIQSVTQTTTSNTSAAMAAATSSTTVPLDLMPKISAHPALGSMQVRCGPRDTFSPSHFVRKRRHGFLSRIRTRKGRATLLRRKLKRRSTLSH